MANQNKPLITIPQLVMRLGLKSRWAVYSLMKKKKIPYYRLSSNQVRFDPDEIDEALAKLRVKEAGR